MNGDKAMNLRKKIVCSLAVTAIVSALITYFVLMQTVYGAFLKLEQDTAEMNLQRVRAAFEQELASLIALNLEWSNWNDTYRFMTEGDDEYIAENYFPSVLQSMEVESILLVDSLGRPVFAYERTADGKAELRAGQVPGYYRDLAESVAERTARKITTAIATNTSEGPVLLVALPILPSDSRSAAQPAGTYVLVRKLDGDRLDTIRQRVGVGFRLASSQSNRNDAALGGRSLSTVSGKGTRALIENFSLPILDGVQGMDEITVAVETPRSIGRLGLDSVHFAIGFLVLSSVGFLLVNLVIINWMIVRPLRRLSGHVLDVQDSGDLSRRIAPTQNDEIGRLTSDVDSMISRLEVAHSQLVSARDKALEGTRAKSQFLANVSHEIRTPINGVLGMAELLLTTTSLNTKQSKYVRTIQHSGDLLLRVISDVLDFSKIEAGRIKLEAAPLDLRSLVEDSAEPLAHIAHQKNVELILDIPVDLSTGVIGDYTRLQQVLTNLIANALKFTPAGQVIVRVAVESTQRDQSTYRFEVEDSGIGIDPRNLEKIFESFSQADSSTTRKFGGTGLGLSICRQLVDLMGGEIGVNSTPGVGSKFWFTVPMAVTQSPAERAKITRLDGTTVLIVDDNATNREILLKQLECIGATVVEADSAAAALVELAQTRDQPVEIAILDYQMPAVDGVELATAIRQHRNHASIALIMLSSVAHGDDSALDEASVCDVWLTKPVRQTQLLETLARVAGPRGRPTASALSPADSPDASPVRVGTPVVALVVGGGYTERNRQERELVQNGIAPAFVNTAGEAVAQLAVQSYDLVLINWSGVSTEARHVIRSLQSSLGSATDARIPVVAVARNHEEAREIEASAGTLVDAVFCSPLATADLQALLPALSAEPVLRAEADTKGQMRARILVVDDNEINRSVAKATLESLGYKAATAEDGDVALQMYASSAYDLVLMDCHMPRMDGYATTQAIRQLEASSASGQRTPIVALTADILQSNREKCRQSGMDDYATKPINRDALNAILTKWLSAAPAVEKGIAQKSTEVPTGAGERFSPTINRNILGELLELEGPGADGRLVRELIVGYCASSARLMMQIRAGLADADPQAVASSAHSLKGASLQIGASFMAEICELLVNAARRGDLGVARVRFEQAAVEHSAVINVLDAEVQQFGLEIPEQS